MKNQTLPPHVLRYFWGDDLAQLQNGTSEKYIVQTILERGDQKAVHWLFETFDKARIKQYLPHMQLSKKSEHFWNLYLA